MGYKCLGSIHEEKTRTVKKRLDALLKEKMVYTVFLMMIIWWKLKLNPLMTVMK